MRKLNPLKWPQTWLPERLRRWLHPLPPPPATDRQRAEDLIRAIDAGGIPLHPARVNAIARSLGLEVSTKAPVEHTITRIRKALAR